MQSPSTAGDWTDARKRKNKEKQRKEGPVTQWIPPDAEPSTSELSLSLPVFLPPDVDVMHWFIGQDWEDQSKENVQKIPHPTIRRQFEDLDMELRVLFDYSNWILATGKVAIETGDVVREAYYQGLLEAVKVEYWGVVKELEPLHKSFYPEVWEVCDYDAFNEEMWRLRTVEAEEGGKPKWE